MTRAARVVEHLNTALHDLFTRDERLFLLGEDVADPYGGAFKVTKGLSTAFPDRVLSTPISEAATLGVANGLALDGRRVIVEVMFGDFATLGFDQLLNFTTKSVSMYGTRTPMPVLLRCPVGGGRGYGPTHSQSLQKHFIGIPHLSLYELSAFHDAGTLLGRALDSGEPAVFFEPKNVYGERLRTATSLDTAGEWMRWRDTGTDTDGPRTVVITAGGTASRAVEAATGRAVDVLIAARLYPFDVEPVLDHILDADHVVVVEESTAGGTWGTEVARHLYERGWGRLRRPVTLVSARDSVIPAAPHLERRILPQVEDILAALDAPTATRSVAAPAHREPTSAPALRDPTDATGATGATGATEATEVTEVRVPVLNSNDTSYVLIEWRVDNGATVTAGDPLVELETAKSVEELPAPASGVVHHMARVGAECKPDEVIAHIGSPPPAQPTPSPTLSVGAAPDLAAAPAWPAMMPIEAQPTPAAALTSPVSRDADIVPTAFVAVRVAVDDALAHHRRRTSRPIAGDGLVQRVVRAVAALREEFPLCFGHVVGPDTVRLAEIVDVRVDVAVRGRHRQRIVRDAAALTFDEITHILLGPPEGDEPDNGALTESTPAEDPPAATALPERPSSERPPAGKTQAGNAPAVISVGWLDAPDLVLVQPPVTAGTTCAIMVAGPDREVHLDEQGRLVERAYITVGLAHDHRFVNGRAAADFVAGIKAALETP